MALQEQKGSWNGSFWGGGGAISLLVCLPLGELLGSGQIYGGREPTSPHS